MPKDLLDHLKTSISKKIDGSQSAASRSSGFASMLLPPPPYPNRLVASEAPLRSIIHAGAHCSTDLGNGSSDTFAAWIDGRGPFVPLPLPADSIPQVVKTSDNLYAVRHKLPMGKDYVGPDPSPLITPIDYLAPAPYNTIPIPDEDVDERVAQSRRYNDTFLFNNLFINRSSTNGPNNSMEKGSCVWSDGTLRWSDKSCGITWVAVHGLKSTCVVTRNADMEQELTPRVRSAQLSKKDVLHSFRKGIIYKVEDLADQIKSFQMSDQSFLKPVGFVSVVEGAHDKGSGHEASSAECNEEKAIKFLQDELKSNTDFTFNKIVQIAIFTLVRLFNTKFKANEIRVIFREEGDKIKELPCRADRTIEEHILRAHQRRCLPQ